MEDVWKEYKTQKLGDYILDIAAGPFGSNLKVECFVPSGFPIIDGANLRGFKVTDNVTKFVTEEKARSLYRSIAKRNDVVVTISGNVGQISYIPYNSKYKEYLVSQRQFRATFDTTKVHVPYLIYYFHTIEGQHKILSFANQTGVPALAQPLKNFKNIDVQLPPLSKQKQIASILSSLDEKIECNKHINDNLPYQLLLMIQTKLLSLKRKNDNLEQQAQALFKSWFVDFEPFKNGEFEESELGMIPKGWKVGKLEEIVKETESGSRPKGGAEIDGVPSVGAEKIERFGVYDYSGEKYINYDYYAKMKRGHIKNGDVLLYKDGAYTGKSSMALDGFPYNECAVNEHVFLLRTESSRFQFFLYFLISYPEIKTMVHTLASAKAAQPGLNQGELLGLNIIIPVEDIIMQFNNLVSPNMHQIANNAKESRRLAQLRDTLLPRLMSGDLKVNELETI